MKQTRSMFIVFGKIIGKKWTAEDGSKWLTIAGVDIPDRDTYVGRYYTDDVELDDGKYQHRAGWMWVRVKDPAAARKLEALSTHLRTVDSELCRMIEEARTDRKVTRAQLAAMEDQLRAPDYWPVSISTGGRGSRVSLRRGKYADRLKAEIEPVSL